MKKRMSLNLNKQTVIRLSSNEVNSIQGGGYNRSERKGGSCKYSRNHPDRTPTGRVIGCL